MASECVRVYRSINVQHLKLAVVIRKERIQVHTSGYKIQAILNQN